MTRKFLLGPDEDRVFLLLHITRVQCTFIDDRSILIRVDDSVREYYYIIYSLVLHIVYWLLL